MDIDAWWGFVERARASAGDRADDRDPPNDPLVPHLVDQLAALPPEQIIAFGGTFSEIWSSAYRYSLWGAAYLIEGGCGDDGFMDFRAGLILLGRDTFTRALEDPDSLAELPVVNRMAHDDKGWIGCEGMNYVSRIAYGRRQGETDSYDAYHEALPRPGRLEPPTGENWDFEDEDEMRRRLPRLAELFL
ncbi:DUF4240 domain-containing protein [Actinomadura sp. HBU206391]|uniref:DUF4240 domain-containing protein n=1 Tax=Actinomadura sp. HBU206391 TaxID=2731692 RepID=UPI001650704D|nr:DUF4240 domain-containing protein [Actinomadura sp. HBU206391]MBC6457604.1 DUF4240 domain-containing protein [Actinomadura sp. HBU206391]